MAFCAWGARWQCVFSASSYSSLGRKVSLGEAGAWPPSFEYPIYLTSKVARPTICPGSRQIFSSGIAGIKRFLKAANFSETTERHVTGFIVAFIMHLGRMSAASAGGAIRVHPRHRAQAMRFLGRNCRTRDLAVLMQLADLLLAFEHRRTAVGC